MSIEVLAIGERRFNHGAGRAFHERVSRAWAGGASLLVLDFADVVAIDSFGVSILVAAHRARPAGSRIVVCHLGENVRDVLEITGLHRFFDVYASVDAVRRAA